MALCSCICSVGSDLLQCLWQPWGLEVWVSAALSLASAALHVIQTSPKGTSVDAKETRSVNTRDPMVLVPVVYCIWQHTNLHSRGLWLHIGTRGGSPFSACLQWRMPQCLDCSAEFQPGFEDAQAERKWSQLSPRRPSSTVMT